MRQYRSSLQILADLLRAVGKGNRKTRIMYRANLSFRLLSRYLDHALDVDLISEMSENDGAYAVTSKGREFLEKYDRYASRHRQLRKQLRVVVEERTMLEKHYVQKMATS